MNSQFNSQVKRRKKGFERASGLLQTQIRAVGESRGFAVSRLLTQWEEIVGTETASAALPVKVSYAQGGMGATLTVLTTGAHAPMLQAELPKIREKVNACYGYSAISRIRITQTAPTGFSEGQVAFSHRPAPDTTLPDPKDRAAARQMTAVVADSSLREALEELGKNVLSRSKSKRMPK
jgi:hypothetical protein